MRCSQGAYGSGGRCVRRLSCAGLIGANPLEPWKARPCSVPKALIGRPQLAVKQFGQRQILGIVGGFLTNLGRDGDGTNGGFWFNINHGHGSEDSSEVCLGVRHTQRTAVHPLIQYVRHLTSEPARYNQTYPPPHPFSQEGGGPRKMRLFGQDPGNCQACINCHLVHGSTPVRFWGGSTERSALACRTNSAASGPPLQPRRAFASRRRASRSIIAWFSAGARRICSAIRPVCAGERPARR